MGKQYLDYEQFQINVTQNAPQPVQPKQLTFGAIHGEHVSASQHLS